MELRTLTIGAMPAVNATLDAATATWALTARARRLARSSLHYGESDFAYFDFTGAFAADGQTLMGFAAVEPESEGDRRSVDCRWLHGLYVDANFHRCGVGSALMSVVEDDARRAGVDRLALRSWRDSRGFFLRQGFTPRIRDGRIDALELIRVLEAGSRRGIAA